ncbi:Nucleoid associated protein NdpA [Vibrio crassostreae]|uniref:nucleoid-associated protein n=1 Tax=Vibrio crassostreae TaxID=246167 RepID=UPI000F4A977C|nr:nucleoid-associated protein [Vibrio crassostreae]ROR15643.1 nucleoid associated protein NdpA [Vibrio crassostreae]CAK1759197.1 Nucleoid associated protein NdpA [Vibrio crassostreae]CAK2265281.1 Nucleoid associated protein NdpA [Vibrio crassostreae]CAK2282033.1 Nucleoid associated protein NdpA [Vibrio crassostreae]CAK3081846.1 Nucleoid associated protein NdpA [Vibrio crassostreae]
MQLTNLYIDKIVIHQIFKRNTDGSIKSPKKSSGFIRFDHSAMETFKVRVIDALGSQSKAVDMLIVRQGQGDVATAIEKLNNANDDDFIDISYDVASKLSEAQVRKSIPGGILVVFKGRYSNPEKSFIGVMKAEIHSAYEKTENPNTNEISLKFVEEALLTPATKLYKTAGFFEKVTDNRVEAPSELNDVWHVGVSDSQISQTDGKAAAQYFYSSFLGCGYPESSAKTTREFYEATCEFLTGMDISEDKRNDLHNALVSYLKYENTAVVSATEFSDRYFDVDTRDQFAEHIEEKGLPLTAFTKDIEQISTRLKQRKLSFSKNVKITAPSDVFKELIDIESITENQDGESVNWTRITVKDRIVSQQ